MIENHDVLYKDMQAIKQISVIPSMLDAICRMTGLGFAAVARVTNDRWLACTVQDDVNFGLAEGAELKIETTICNEIRDSKKPVVIDHVDLDEEYKNHHTPKMYGLQSYISFPIILKNGDFFGTLCAIGTKPAKLNDPKIKTTFELFAELISFHLQSIELLDRSHNALNETSRQLNVSDSEIQQYKKISDHSMKEQVRKITIFSDILLRDTDENDITKVKQTAFKINSFARELTHMMEDLTKLSSLTNDDTDFMQVDLNDILKEVRNELQPKLEEKKLSVTYDLLPTLSAIPRQMSQLFYQLIERVAGSANGDNKAIFEISSKNLHSKSLTDKQDENKDAEYCNILITSHGMKIEKSRLDDAFDIFIHAKDKKSKNNYDSGLAYCQKIVHNHGGEISIEGLGNGELSVSIVLPLNYKLKAKTGLLAEIS